MAAQPHLRSQTTVVEARGLRKRYKGREAVAGIDFAVRTGECLGFLGPNGAGKSTTMRMVCGLARADEGTLRVLGHDVADQSRALKARVGVVPQHDNLDPDLDLRGLLVTQGRFHRLSRAHAVERMEEALTFARLQDRATARVEQLSGGMRRRLMIARALVSHPSLLVLDEPTTGLDPRARREVWSALDTLRAAGMTLLLTTHYMEEAVQMCDRVAVMHSGRIADEGTPTELMRRHEKDDLEAVFIHLSEEPC